MPQFLFAYHGGTVPESEADVADTMAAWGAWFESIGADTVDGGNPVGLSRTVDSTGVTDNGGSNPVSGYSVIKAESHDEAMEIAGRCPIVSGGGSVEVAEIVEM